MSKAIGVRSVNASPRAAGSRGWLAAAVGLCLAGCGPHGPASRPEAAAAAADPAAATPAPVATRPPVVRSEGGCRALAPDDAAADAALRACARARAELARLLTGAAPPGVVAVEPGGNADGGAGDAAVRREPDERWALAVDPGDVATERELGDGRRISADGYLAHEAAHRVASAMIYPADTAFGPDAGYGTPLPDWLDEALALVVEPAADREARLGLLFADGLVYALPLRRFLYMAHPALAGAPPGSPLRRVFYGQSLAFALYLQERGGTGALAAVVGALRAGRTQGVALTDLPGTPGDGGALEQDWLAWLRRRRDAVVAAAGPEAGRAGR